METYIALLRSINIGSRNRVAMPDLRRVASSLGYREVSTYLQSGNLVFLAAGDPADVSRDLGEGVVSQLGVDVPVIVRTRSQLRRIVRGNPFAGLELDPKSVHVTFLSEKPDSRAQSTLLGRTGEFADDRLALGGSEVFLHCPGGYAETKLNNAYLERQLGTTATTRNWRTVTALVAMADK